MKSTEKSLGIGAAILSSSTFGLAPFFSIGLLDASLSSCEVLSYRWGFAALFLTIVGLLTGHSYRIQRQYFGTVLWLSILRAATSFFLIIAYAQIASGVASTIHFVYPLAVAMMMMFFFHEKGSIKTYTAIILSFVGASMLSLNGASMPDGNTLLGISCACLSVFTYGGYMVGVKNSRAAKMDSTVLTCYVMGLGALFFICGGIFTGGVRLLDTPSLWLYALGLAIPATAISNIALVWGIHRIGPTLTSFFGALEPLTAVIIGVLFLGEPFSIWSALGIVIVIAAVLLIGTDKKEG